jgi:hypothetical protein
MKEEQMEKDDYHNILQGMRLIEDLLIPQVTPRVPSHIRERARDVIADFPTEENLKTICESRQPTGSNK